MVPTFSDLVIEDSSSHISNWRHLLEPLKHPLPHEHFFQVVPPSGPYWARLPHTVISPWVECNILRLIAAEEGNFRYPEKHSSTSSCCRSLDTVLQPLSIASADLTFSSPNFLPVPHDEHTTLPHVLVCESFVPNLLTFGMLGTYNITRSMLSHAEPLKSGRPPPYIKRYLLGFRLLLHWLHTPPLHIGNVGDFSGTHSASRSFFPNFRNTGKCLVHTEPGFAICIQTIAHPPSLYKLVVPNPCPFFLSKMPTRIEG